MRVFITGGTGLIGRNLARRLAARGDSPIILTRRADEVRRDPEMRSYSFVSGDPNNSGPWQSALDGCDAVVNLVGHNIFSERWNPEIRRKIRDSRIYGTQNVAAAITKAKHPPQVLVQASAVGYYGSHGDEELTEDSPSGSDFMAVVCREWEDAVHPAETRGVRVARIRTGIVLARDEGALAVMTPIFKWGPGAPIGSDKGPFSPGMGHQWMSWIHIDDIVGLFLLALDRPEATGPLNGTAPHPVKNADFSRILSKVLWKPYAPWRVYLPFGPPDILLKLILGGVAKVVTEGQRVLPKKAEQLGFSFQYPDLEGALRAIFAQPTNADSPSRNAATTVAHSH